MTFDVFGMQFHLGPVYMKLEGHGHMSKFRAMDDVLVYILDHLQRAEPSVYTTHKLPSSLC